MAMTPPQQSDVEAAAAAANEKSPSPKMANIVNWDGEGDQENPMDWPSSKKWTNTIVISLMSFSAPIASSMFAPGVKMAMKDLHSTDSDLETWVVSIFLLGFAAGPFLVAPISELYGRRLVYIVANFFYFAFTIGCATSTSIGMLCAFRFLAGCAGSAPLTLGGATIGDMFPNDKRGGAMSLWGIGPLLGPVVGPIIGGYLAQGAGWRWVFWLLTILSGTTLGLGVIFLRETYAMVLLERKTQRIIRETGDQSKVSALNNGLTSRELFKRASIRPIKMFALSPIVLFLSIYMAVIFGYLYLLITSFVGVFTGQYHFSLGSSGLAYLGLGVGLFMGLILTGKLSDPLYIKLRTKNNGISKPEFRLPPLMLGGPLISAAFFWFGWSVEANVQYVVPIIGTSLFGMGMIPTFMCINLYLVDTYKQHAASAIAATRLLQSLGGALLPLAGPKLFGNLGYGWGCSLLAFIAMAFIPVPWIFYRYGEKIRNFSTVKF